MHTASDIVLCIANGVSVPLYPAGDTVATIRVVAFPPKHSDSSRVSVPSRSGTNDPLPPSANALNARHGWGVGPSG